MTLPPPPDLPEEPLLALCDIQGMALPGFAKPYQTLLFFRHFRTIDGVRDLKRTLADLLVDIAPARAVLEDRRARRRLPQPARAQFESDGAFVGVAFTYPGLLNLAPSARDMESVAFKLGMPARAALLGDPVDPQDPHHASAWVVGAPQNLPDSMFVIAGDSAADVATKRKKIVTAMAGKALPIVHEEAGTRLGDGGPSREHFGFVDGISQPGIRGRASAKAGDFLTPRSIAGDWPTSALYGYPGQDLVWPGEFVLGYPRNGPDPLRPGACAVPVPGWTENGSFLVYRRLAQDVGAFWDYMTQEAARLAQLPGFGGMTPVALAARMIGRWPGGAPLSRVANGGAIGADGFGGNVYTNNNFRFESAPPPITTFATEVSQTEQQDIARLEALFPPGPPDVGDPLGRACPIGAHIRRLNPRDSPTDLGGSSSTLQRRILRVGIPFGAPHSASGGANGGDASHDAEVRGQHFLCIQSSIDEQFEFLQARWMNDERRPTASSGHDLVAGQPGGDGGRRCPLQGPLGERATVQATQPFVQITGGGYFFVPSLSALRMVLTA